jgi:lysophospholipase L1-like esterase
MDPKVMADPLFQESASIWTIKPKVFDKYGKRGLTLALQNMDKLAALCKKFKIKLTVAVYPWPQQIQARNLDNLQVTTWRKYAELHGARFVNLFPKFIDARDHATVRASYFLDGDVHWNAAGHQLVADSVVPLFR